MNPYLCPKNSLMTIRPLTIFINTIFALILISLVTVSCRKDDKISSEPSYKLVFSADTIIFDTVFTTIGSTTRYLKVYNRNNERISISNISLAEGTNSQYQLNIDGTPATSMKDVELDAEDSLYIFVKVTVNPTLQNSPLIITDSIVFTTNGNIQDVDLAAWGQDAHFFVGNKKIEGLLSYPYIILADSSETVTWEDDKPYVIYGWGIVYKEGILNIGPGCNIHFHQNSGLWIYRGGSIHVNGELDSIVTFQGDRLDMEFRDLPGQWDRIWINEGSIDNEFNFAVIRNGFIGIQAENTLIDTTSMLNTLLLNNTIIENMSLWGMFTVKYRVIAANSVFANCAENTLFLSVGGNYDFRHCTFANYWTRTVRIAPSFIISNNLITSDPNDPLLGNLENAYFGNCIIYGANDEEIILSENDQVLFNYKFDHCLLKTALDISDPQFYINCIKNSDPEFVDYIQNNYRLDTLSSAINIGSIEIVNGSTLDITNDLDGNARNSDVNPDAGAYEFIPQVNNKGKKKINE
jgi:hypothetical protein